MNWYWLQFYEAQTRLRYSFVKIREYGMLRKFISRTYTYIIVFLNQVTTEYYIGSIQISNLFQSTVISRSFKVNAF